MVFFFFLRKVEQEWLMFSFLSDWDDGKKNCLFGERWCSDAWFQMIKRNFEFQVSKKNISIQIQRREILRAFLEEKMLSKWERERERDRSLSSWLQGQIKWEKKIIERKAIVAAMDSLNFTWRIKDAYVNGGRTSAFL